jgi:uncharacterized protein (TIGR00266 family)
MNVTIKGKPVFGHLHVVLDPGESILAESDAMASMASNLDMASRLNGSFFSAIIKKYLGGESLFINEFSNKTSSPLHLTITQPVPGDVLGLELSGESFYLQPGAYIASTPGVRLSVAWAGLASFIAREGLFRLKVSGKGQVWFGAFGGLVEKHIEGEYIVDTSHLVGYDPEFKLHIQLAGGFFSSIFGGEGLVTRMKGTGKIVIQTRSISSLAKWINRFLP